MGVFPLSSCILDAYNNCLLGYVYMIRQSVLIPSLLSLSFALSAASPDVHGALRHLPLRFESAADGRLVAREGAYSLAVEAGKTTVTVTDRTKQKSASVTTTLAGADPEARPVGTDPFAAKASYLLGSDPAKQTILAFVIHGGRG